jgi:hypothetical protein
MSEFVIRAPYSGWRCKKNTRGFILVRAKEVPTSSGEGRVLYFLAPKCRERGNRSQVSKKEYNGVLLEMLISKVGKMSVLFFRCPSFSLESALPSPFIDSREGQGLQQTLGGALEEKAERALSVLLWRRAPVCAGHLWDVVVMLMTGRRDIWGAAEYVRFPMVDVRVVVPLFD